MKNNILLISDSSCDLTYEEASKLGFKIAPFLVSANGTDYKKEDENFNEDDFYQSLVDNPKWKPKSACPELGDYIKLFEEAVSEGKDVICLCLTSKFSGSYNAALNAKEMVLEDYEDAKIEVIDSESITCCQGMLVKEVLKMIESGMSFEDVVENTNELKKSCMVLFTIGEVDYLRRGGRIGQAALTVVSKANIRPLINFRDGDIFIKGIALGRARSILKVLEKIKAFFKEVKNVDDYVFCVGYGYSKQEGEEFRKSVIDIIKEFTKNAIIEIHQIGATIGVHTGPNPLGLCFMKKFKG